MSSLDTSLFDRASSYAPAAWVALGSLGWLMFSAAAERRDRIARRRGERLLAASGADGTSPPRAATRRLTGLLEGAGKPVGRTLMVRGGPPGAALAGWVLVGGVVGMALGAAAGYAVWRWQRRGHGRPSDGVARDVAASRQLPLAADLLAACIAAGAGPREAAEAVGESLGGPLGERLAGVAVEIRLGAEPSRAWGRLAEIPGAAPLARCLERAGTTGAPAAEAVSRLADMVRAERADVAVARAQRAGVLITAPVGLCFLPAFLAVGVAPVVVGLATGLLASR
ncbi:type II secretion system F family protein [uncultured Streptomyces sp.]|uniref:type II secretion system F family protein n=1 Tax=uncultured Streptomyces sp. TaxID=174707 RepID=UPI002628106E|nr:type II secretion system F family protein [uncultured Streptomyces sp.]